MESGLARNTIVTELTRSPHRDLAQYLPVGAQAVAEDPEFFAHLIAWNHQKGEVRDAKVALPMIALAHDYTGQGRASFVDNALAHLADLNPRLLVRALEFRKAAGAPKNLLHRFVARYLREYEADPRDWDNVALQHKASLTHLYSCYHVARDERVGAAFGWKSVDGTRPPRRGKFAVVATLAALPVSEIVAAIERYKLPWLVVRGALGARAKEPDVLMALVSRMTAADIVTMSKTLIKMGVKDHPQTRAAYEQALEKAAKPKKARGTTLKAGKAAKVLKDLGEEKIAGKLQALQEKQLDHAKTIDGDWLILGDKSGSMHFAIAATKRIAAVLGRLVKGDVHLVFFDNAPRYVGNVRGKSLEAIEMTTAALSPSGGTAIGCGLVWARERKLKVDGIALVSDGGERHPPDFASSYLQYCETLKVTPTVYFYKLGGDPDFLSANCQRAGIDLQTFDLRTTRLDDVSLPTLVQTMRVGRYDLGDEILATPLRTLDEAMPRTAGVEVFRGQTTAAAGR